MNKKCFNLSMIQVLELGESIDGHTSIIFHFANKITTIKFPDEKALQYYEAMQLFKGILVQDGDVFTITTDR